VFAGLGTSTTLVVDCAEQIDAVRNRISRIEHVRVPQGAPPFSTAVEERGDFWFSVIAPHFKLGVKVKIPTV
jgi:hypothetical protein